MSKTMQVLKPFTTYSRKAIENLGTHQQKLRGVFVDGDKMYATNSHYLFVAQNDTLDSGVHYFSDKDSKYALNHSLDYPNIQRVIPNHLDAKGSFTINTETFHEFKNANELALATKQRKKNTTKLDTSIFKMSVKENEELEPYKQVSFSYDLRNILESNLNGELFSFFYDASYMNEILKAFKKLKETEITVYYHGNMRPIQFVGKNSQAVLMPIRSY